MVDRFFAERAFPILTPMAVDPAHPSPRYHNRSLYLAALLGSAHGAWGRRTCSPSCNCRRCCRGWCRWGRGTICNFILLEDAVSARLPELFGGFDVLSSTTFRITRDSDVELLEQESDDMLRLIEKRLRERQRGQAVRLEVAADASEELIRMIVEPEEIKEGDASPIPTASCIAFPARSI